LAVALSTPLAKVSQTQRDATATFSFLEEEEEEDLAGDFGTAARLLGASGSGQKGSLGAQATQGQFVPLP
jgi:hypothetical protein